MIRFGKCKSINGARVRVSLVGYSGDASVDCLLMQPCASGPSVWMPPAVGDVVVVWFDEDFPEDSVVLGSVYPDGINTPKDGPKQAAVTFDEVYLGNPTPETKCPRDDKLQAQLSAIKSELDSFVAAFNAHTHTVATVTAADAAAIVAAAAVPGSVATTAMLAGPTTSHAQGYSVAATDSECVWVR